MTTAANLQPLLHDPRLWRGSSVAPIRAHGTGHAALDAVLPGGGWPLGALSEVLYPHAGVGELSLVLPLLAQLTQRGRHVAFVAPRARPYAPALAAAGVQLSQVLVVEPRDDTQMLWVSEQLLHARTGAVLLWGEARIDTTALRRLQLAAETGDGIGVLYRPPAAEHMHSIAALRLRIELRDGAPQVEVLKCRGVRPAGWHALGDMRPSSVGRARGAQESGRCWKEVPAPRLRRAVTRQTLVGAAHGRDAVPTLQEKESRPWAAPTEVQHSFHSRLSA